MTGSYFASADDADGWLSFDAGEEEREQRFYAENDRYEEWLRWQRAWEAGAV